MRKSRSSGFVEVWYSDVSDETDAADRPSADCRQLRYADGVANVKMIWIPARRPMLKDGTETGGADWPPAPFRPRAKVPPPHLPEGSAEIGRAPFDPFDSAYPISPTRRTCGSHSLAATRARRWTVFVMNTNSASYHQDERSSRRHCDGFSTAANW